MVKTKKKDFPSSNFFYSDYLQMTCFMEEFIEANKIAMIVVKELNEIFVEEI